MKVYFFLAVIVALAVGCRAARACYQNPYIQIRQNYFAAPLHFLSEVVSITTSKYSAFKDTCGGEWAKFGFCCNPWQLPTHIKYNENLIAESVQVVIQAYKNLNGYVDEIFMILKKLALSKPMNQKLTINANIKFAQDLLNDGSVLDHFDTYSKIGTPSDAERYKTEMEKCLTDMTVMRTASICATCSGRSQVFFSKGRGLATEDVCQRSLDKCLVSLKMTFRFIRLLNWLIDLGVTLKERNIRINLFSRIAQLALASLHNELTFDSLYSKLDLFETPEKMSSKTRDQICNSYFSLAKLPFIVRLRYKLFTTPPRPVEVDYNSLAPIEASASSFSSLLPAFELSLRSALAEWRSKHKEQTIKTGSDRKLELELGEEELELELGAEELYDSDVSFLKPTDSLFDTFALSVDAEYAHLFKPMNLSLKFP